MPGHGVGGSLHSVLEDSNLERSSIAWCRAYALKEGDTEGARIAESLLRLSRRQRTRLRGYYSYYA